MLTFKEVDTIRIAAAVELSDEQPQQLEKQARAGSVSVRLAQRSKMILLAASGLSDIRIGAELGVKRQTVARWRSRFNRLGLPGIEKDAPRPGRKCQISAKRVKQIVRMTTCEKPGDATHWSTRSMAQAAGISEASVRHLEKAWPEAASVAHPQAEQRSFYLRKKVADRGPLSESSEYALVLSVDEKSQVQALDLTQPGLPLKKGRAGTMTHDYKCNGTTPLFAALNTLNGNIIATCMPPTSSPGVVEVLASDRQGNAPNANKLHLIIDNYSPHKHPEGQACCRNINGSTFISLRPVLAEHGREIFQRPDSETNTSRLLRQHRRTNRNNRTLRCSTQLQPKAFCLDRQGFGYFGKVKRARTAFHKL